MASPFITLKSSRLHELNLSPVSTKSASKLAPEQRSAQLDDSPPRKRKGKVKEKGDHKKRGGRGRAAPAANDLVYDEEAGEEEEEEQKAPMANGATEERRQEFLQSIKVPPKLSALSDEDQQQRLDMHEQRQRFVLNSLQQSAKAIPWEGIVRKGTEKGMTIAWWHFLTYMSVDLVLEKIVDSTPYTVRLVLGRPLSKEELLLLPSEWPGVILWGTYFDMVTGKHITNGDDMEPYTGSTTGRKGLDQRLSVYESVYKGTRKSDGGRHELEFKKERAKLNLRILSASAASTPKPYIMLAELAHMILLQTWENRTNKYLPQAAIDIMRAATPSGLPVKQFAGLNRASQLCQGLGRNDAHRVCSNCARKNHKGIRYMTEGSPFMKMVCHLCFQYLNIHHVNRPVALETKAVFHRALRKATDKPADGLCERINCTSKFTHISKHLNVWICRNCNDAKVLVKDVSIAAKRKAASVAKAARPKPLDGICERPNSNAKAANAFNTTLNLWTCRPCQGAKILERLRGCARKSESS